MTPADLAAQAADLAHQASILAQNAAGVAAVAAQHVPPAAPFIYLFSIFVLAVFVGYYVVWSVTPALHSPLMAVTNAISSVIIVGAMLATGLHGSIVAHVLGFLAVVLVSVNIFGGFAVTNRMLSMFKKK
ncbi:proton-translocating transhydrogenase family protein [Acidocella aminolytica]|jgi:NAD(P) transhydrogenase subunit alpha|uniref:proton-translocating NAD(P)(+) transhydrogenase n=1 Tax=Acidocella aminolytica 101 = DSM 11237 TaxID=1120923 RepID=A0A0D6PDM0_9PROT|nr:proton-translocating transhydrogenase family protein [Acidocella aminolytica]GAN79752.1 NAD/NADP transhydrogenase subunit alpha [Acidocella aminolytica 101 = DSM 11237]GBQ35621.1 NAD/NADP transhydrogenase subunit alpha [Acidocella aminolytica 101 = DSM 11237]SHE75206.1 NAD(P) transhydrogenase subunit alpha [Acidocella aminolytica 101 = DSM 11237]